MKNQRSLMLVLSLFGAALASTSAWADAPRYDFLDVAYQTINDPSGSGISSDHAYLVDGSYAFTPNWIGAASYGHESADFKVLGFSGTETGNVYSAGVGYRFPLTSSLDLVPNVSYVSAHASASVAGFSNSTSDTGYDVGLQLRAMVMDALELDANVDHSTPGASANTVSVAALYNFTASFAVGLGYGTSTSDGQDTSAWTVALRYYFN
jgi:hypothetical protein